MRSIYAVIAVISIAFTNSSCEKESSIWENDVPQICQESPAVTSAPATFRSSTDTTLQLMSTRSVLDTTAVTYTLHFERYYTGSIQALAPYQQLAFTDGNQHSQQHTLYLQSFVQTGISVSLVFDYGAQDLTGLELEPVQAIIVEDVVMN